MMRGAEDFASDDSNAAVTRSGPSVFVRIVVSKISDVIVNAALSSSSKMPALLIEHIEVIGELFEFLRRLADARGIGDINFQERRAVADLLCGLTARLLVACAEKNAKAFFGELPRDFETDSFVRAGNERDFFFCLPCGRYDRAKVPERTRVA